MGIILSHYKNPYKTNQYNGMIIRVARCLRRSNGIIYNPSARGVYNDDVAGAWPVPDLWQNTSRKSQIFCLFLFDVILLNIFTCR